MSEEERDVGQRIVHGSCGAFLAGLISIGVMILWSDFNWWVVGGCAAFGFVLAWFLGEQAIDFLKSLFWSV